MRARVTAFGRYEAYRNAQTDRVVDFVSLIHGDARNGLLLARYRGCHSDERAHTNVRAREPFAYGFRHGFAAPVTKPGVSE